MNFIANTWNLITFNSAIGAAIAAGVAIIIAAIAYRTAK